MKKNLSIALILCIIAGLSGLLIALVNEVTKNVILENKIKAENSACEEIYNDGIFIELEEEFTDENIIKKWQVNNNNNNQIIGYVYKVSGKNAYGTIEALVGIDQDGSIKEVVLITNSQSFAKIVNEHVEESYNSNDNLTSLDNVDVTCGATFGAKLVKKLIQSALNDFKGVK